VAVYGGIDWAEGQHDIALVASETLLVWGRSGLRDSSAVSRGRRACLTQVRGCLAYVVADVVDAKQRRECQSTWLRIRA
jgi:hypothetical protein